MIARLVRNHIFGRQRCPKSVQHVLRTLHTDAANIRNIALMAHIDSGKTTLTESILHASEYVSNPGSVDSGSTTTDFLPAERERGITIQSASIPVHWKKWIFNLIDTPGHADFGMEVESASRVVDGAVVLLDGVEGVEAQTRGVWSQLNRHQVPTRLLFINKLDRAGSSLRNSILSVLSNHLHPRPTLLCLPVASFDTTLYQTGDSGLEGIVDIVRWRAFKWNTIDAELMQEEVITGTPEELLSQNHPLLPEIKQARTDLIDLLSVHSPELMDEFLSLDTSDPYLTLPSTSIVPHLRQLTLRKEILPVFCGAALRHIGTKNLMDYIGDLLASPVDVNTAKAPAKRGFVNVLAWKVGWDKQKGWMTFVRVYGGTLTKSTMLYNTSTRQKERISKLMLCYAAEHKEVEELPFGSVGVIFGLRYTRTGDTLVSASSSSDPSVSLTTNSISAPPATISASVVSQSQSDIQGVQNALNSLSRTDPSVRWTEEDGQTLVHGLGALHLEIVDGRLREEFGAQCTLGKRRVSYKETFSKAEEVAESMTWDKDVLGKPARAFVELSVRRLAEDENGLDEWDGNLVLDAAGKPLPASAIDTGKFPLDLLALVQGLRGPLSASPHSALPITGTCITIKNYSSAPGSPPAALASASSAILRDILKNSGGGELLEPYIKVKVSVPETYMGKVVKDLSENNGEIQEMATDGTSLSSMGGADEVAPFSQDGLYIPPGWMSPSAVPTGQGEQALFNQKRSVYALAPLSKMLDYQTRLRAVSGGQATFEMSNIGFRQVDPMRRMEILQELGRA
ncbi:Ribosome-releasing factor 2, mitochondrial {ECO:0000255/HAMAP-Rule:MF_03059} Short=RRF2mt {ECO:0000255/HAMAP-Rule:MF_03059}; AltName: Full=Elongation factor G 2, mitochondrial {ECO:0000255/HAMAP-Rule:MF_03059}; Short=EF-G2mt {ECO:0000255/HAMAP-Rule:MF_03059}; Short=mEF-G 2 {ECO:0000255/HAMAP-Rule:MF_03059}; Flags: Precursor [Serendipita indica DSM 11827]|nr:Ribosome-releasing factor 2, mitochondrial {ECO:0000255/HAMAP-Rule:MF_03059} Short=RRF2mt {ECO:0000255/HAMAP-Rule:MF_03059}; AltName: Full=Elongation factor G 2, mitochondrial {ECO:0000255/HAMAP-Rule:MF_03059}; Short=EF-G2mt {ECO:0000255/HAMAP-Rule:MF_03059}; Short=mEF-G 2 {ECO:0000255/HAMAP-Rule:MF_03059}; Flags: Precursor [Serendipita indica DSM 11827]